MKQKNLLFRIFLVIFLVAVAGIIGLLVRDHIQKDKDQKLREKAAVSVQEEPEVSAEAEETPVQIPVDFSVLQAENPDIYAWIHIADTPVDYPILQSKVDDDYYMDHTVDDKEGLPGAIMTEYSYNPEPFESLIRMSDFILLGGLEMRSDLKTNYTQRDTERAGQTEKALYLLNTISAITDRGNNAEVRRKKDGSLIVYEVKKNIVTV